MVALANIRVALTTLGCKVNQFESASFLSGFRAAGAEVVDFSQVADIYIVNSCAVTAKAGSQSRNMIRRALRLNPKARIVVTGCYAQIATQEILELANEPICIVGNGNKHLLVEIALANTKCDLEIYMHDIGRKKEICDLPVDNFIGRTRAYLRIQDGCNNFCSYCIVPYTRGRVRSLSPGKVVEQTASFVAQGIRELVLTGIHVGAYGQDFDPPLALLDILKELARLKNGLRYRISSLEPGEVTEELLSFLAENDCFMPHFHLPLQSGDDGILKKMNRRYTVAEFRSIVEKIGKYLPTAAIGVDVLVGFPGEDEAAFQATQQLLVELPLTYLHVFPYSKRPGTLAAGMPGQLAKKIKEERVALLRELDHKKRSAFYAKHVGSVVQVLAEGDDNPRGLMKGFSENYIPVQFVAEGRVANTVVAVRIERVVDERVVGSLVADEE